jgi:Glucodextranase, domain B
MKGFICRFRHGLLCSGLTLAALAVVGVGSAQAAVTQTNVTSAGPAFSFGNDDISSTDPSNVRTVTGTSNGTAGTDQVDIRCEAPGGTDILLTSDVTVGTGGSFSTTVNDTTGSGNNSSDFEGSACRIVAVPAGTDPTDLSTYTGPVVGNGDQSTTTKDGVEEDYFVSQPQTSAYNDYDSLGSCGLCDSRLYGSDLTPGSLYLWYDNAPIYSGTYTVGANQLPYAQIDGNDVYDPDQANDALTGAPALSFTHTVDPTTGDMEITETDPFVKCASGASPCATSYTTAGLELDRTILQSQSGQVVRITDVIRSTDNTSHTYSFAYDEDEDGDSGSVEFQFAGDSGFKAYAGGATGALSTSSIQTIYAIADGTEAPGLNNPTGAITVSPAPSAAEISCQTTSPDCAGFDLVYTGTVPAGGSRTISQYFGMGASASAVQGYVTSNTQALTPTVAITTPATNGTTVHTPSIAVSGTVSANVTSLTVDGTAVTPSGGGAWSTTVNLNQGVNTITAVATDGEGVSATATQTVTYTPTPPPAPVKTAVKLGTIKVKGTELTASVTCTVASGSKCAGSLVLTVRERVKVKRHKTKLETVTVGKAKYSLSAGKTTVSVSLNGMGRKLLAKTTKLSTTVNLLLGSKTVTHKTATFKAAKKKKHKK